MDIENVKRAAEKSEDKKPPVVQSRVTIAKAAEQIIDVADVADLFTNEYNLTGGRSDRSNTTIVRPPINPNQLQEITFHNSVLLPLIQAMDVNCETTGHTFEIRDGYDRDDQESVRQLAVAQSLFSNPYPQQSTIETRSQLRTDLESIGYGGIEVLRNLTGEIIFFRAVPGNEIRVIKRDKNDPVEPVTVTRPNLPDAEIQMRRRRYVRLIDGKRRYYRDFGSSRELNATDGQWQDDNTQIAAEDLANELIFFTLVQDPHSPYGYPRWICELPSVLGGRAAEESNLELLVGGGIPPILVSIMGGALTEQSKQQLQAYLNPQHKKQRSTAAIIEILSTGGNIDGAETPARIDVQKFGSSDLNDAMFTGYDRQTRDKIRGSFRLGGVFLGEVADANRANSTAQYISAETQVFSPERYKFDENINSSLMLFVAPRWKFVSNGQTFIDVQRKLSALGLAKNCASEESWLTAINTAASVSLEPRDPVDPDSTTTTQTTPATITPSTTDGVEDVNDSGTQTAGDTVVTRELTDTSTEATIQRLFFNEYDPDGMPLDDLAEDLERFAELTSEEVDDEVRRLVRNIYDTDEPDMIRVTLDTLTARVDAATA